MSFEETHSTGQSHLKIVKFKSRKNYYLYIYDSDTRKVSYTSLGSNDLEYCKSNWFKSYEKYVRKGGSPTQVRKSLLTKKLKEYVDHTFNRVDRGEIKERSFKTIWERVRNRITPYIVESKIQTVQEINRKTFLDYCVYWRDKGKDITTINNDVGTFNNFLMWLVEQDDLDLGKTPKIKKLKVVKDYKRESNPPFTGEDWNLFKETLYRYETLDGDEQEDLDKLERWWFRKNFVNWIFFQYFSGNRNHESFRLTYGDVSVDRFELPNGKTTLRGTVKIPSDTKRGRNTKVINGTPIQRIFQHTQYSKHPKVMSLVVDDNTPLFVNPFTGKSVHQESMRRHFQQCIKFSGLEGKGYTLYSLRSTHITMMLLNGTSVDDISRNMNTSPEMIRRHYDGVENILKSNQLLRLNRQYFEDVVST